jgi:hypothetical protein
MNGRKDKIDPIPDEFESYEEAAEFWDSHDTTDYLDLFVPVEAEVEFHGRYYEIEIEEDIALALRTQAKQLGLSAGQLASDLLRRHVAPVP